MALQIQERTIMMLRRSITTLGFAACFTLAAVAGISAADPMRKMAETPNQPQAEPKRVNCDCLNADFESPAKSAADAWLVLVDRGDYSQSYAAASRIIRDNRTSSSWLQHMWDVRHCLGAVEGRDLISCQMCCNPSDMPSGQYYYFQYHTCFQCGDPVCETLILRSERDCACGCRWKVAHYCVE